MEDRKFKISVIIPVYNVENYLAETLDSVISQTIGFEKNVQVVLMNDGSKDNSEKVCLKYKEKYPNNIVYVKQENSGVSKARNNAIEYAKGELVTFLDSDDKWSKDAFKAAYTFWTKHKEVKVISCKLKFFDGRKGDHPLNYKFDKDRVADIRKDYKDIQLGSSSVFIVRETLVNYRYDETLKYAEDFKLINQILFDNPKMGILKRPIYHYRRRSDFSSAMQSSVLKKTWYINTLKQVHEYLLELSVQKFSKELDYIKFALAYDIGWRINVHNYEEILTVEEQKEYVDILDNLIKKVNLEFFLDQRHISLVDKIYILSVKENKPMNELIKVKNNKILIKGFDSTNTSKSIAFLTIDNLYVRNNKMHIWGKFNTTIYDKNKVSLFVNNKKHKIEFYELKYNTDVLSYKKEYVIKNIGVKAIIDLDKVNTISFAYDNNKGVNIVFGKRGMLTSTMKGSYFTSDKKIFTYDNGKINISKDGFFKRVKRECKNILSLLKNGKLKHLTIRFFIIFTRPFYSKNIWLISDRINAANDNGEHLFRYLCNKKIKEVRPYFVIAKETDDYIRMKQYGRVVNVNSLKYKMLFVHSKYIISSHAEDYITNIFGRSNKYFYDLLKFRYVFLQHGIIANDLSSWLNPNAKAIDMFVTSAKAERDSIIEYGFDKEVVKLTGLARYDSLLDNVKPKKQILLLPTWRANLANKIDRTTGERAYNEEFKESDFFKFYNELLNNEDLIAFLKEKGYKIKLCPHPNLLVQMKDFDLNDVVQVEKGTINYQQEFKDAAMLITDYSSVFFDVAYLQKPIIYTQFDIDTFYEGQVYERGYFDYSKDGFGTVCKDVSSAVAKIKEIINKGCKMEKEYITKVKKFYYKMDTKNCERIYNEIINLD